MTSEVETKVLICAGNLWARFSERINKLPQPLQLVFFEDLETTIENRLKVLEAFK